MISQNSPRIALRPLISKRALNQVGNGTRQCRIFGFRRIFFLVLKKHASISSGYVMMLDHTPFFRISMLPIIIEMF
jgi:hypothetical protein